MRGPGALRRALATSVGCAFRFRTCSTAVIELRRRRRHRHQSQARRAHRRGRSGAGDRPAPGRDDDRRLRTADGAAPEAEAGAPARRRRGARPGRRRRPAAAIVHGLCRPGAGDARGAVLAALGRMDPCRGRRLRGQPAADAGLAARHGRGGADTRAPPARGHGLHQRRRQLQRLAASLLSLSGAAPCRAHAARADLGGNGLQSARRRRRGLA